MTTPHVDWEKIKKTRVTVPIAALLIGAFVVWQGVGKFTEWHVDNFLTTAAAGDISDAVQANATVIAAHLNDYQINEAERNITNIQDQLFNLTQWVEANGETDITRQRKNELQRRLQDWRDFKQCLVNGFTNCASLRP
jgi:hypothetical protein